MVFGFRLGMVRSTPVAAVGAAVVAAGMGWLLLGVSHETQAATTTSNMTVQVQITAGCSVTGSTLDFGSNNGNALLSGPLSATGNIAVTCTTGSPYSIGLNNGSNASGNQRRMSNGSGDFLNYNLFTDNLATLAWTTGASSTTCTTLNSCVLGTGTGATQNIPIYGRIPLMVSSPPQGTYTDTVTITVTY